MAAPHKTKPRLPASAEPKPAAAAADDAASRLPLVPASLSLKLLVFISGAVLMGLEIVGSRILAPYFGNSVFVWGSLISLFLIALSVGYYFGGRVADRWPSRRALNGIVIAVAASMFVVAAAAGPVGDAILQAGFGEKSGPFLASAILFLLPSIGMGMVSPFAIRLATHTVASVGKTSGTLYALSTLGSIAGTMITTFVLIPSIGAGMILKGLAATLLGAGIVTFPFASLGSAAASAVAAAISVAACIYAIPDARAALAPGSKLKLDVDTPYHHISVVDDAIAGSRQLRFDRYVESAIQIDPPHHSLSPYTRYFHLAFLAQPEIRRAMFIGAGGGVGPRAFHIHDAEMEIDVVDIDEEVLRVAREFFYMPNAATIRPIAADGRSFVRDAEDGHYDAIILDAFTIGGRIPFHLVTREFFALCREKLAPGGVLVMNINSSLRGPSSAIYQSMFKTIDDAFPHVHAFAVGSRGMLVRDSTNVMLVAVNADEELAHEDWAARAAAYESASYVDRRQVETMVGDLVTTLPEVDGAAGFTDDYAPIETMAFE